MRGMSRVSKRGLELLVFQDMRVYTYIYICAYTHIYVLEAGCFSSSHTQLYVIPGCTHMYAAGYRGPGTYADEEYI